MSALTHQIELLASADSVGCRVNRARGAKCLRCWKILPEVGLVPEAPDVCLRCASVLESEHGWEFATLDPHELAIARFDRLMAEFLEQGSSVQEAVRKAGALNAG